MKEPDRGQNREEALPAAQLVIRVDKFHAEAIVPAPFTYPLVSVAPPNTLIKWSERRRGSGYFSLPQSENPSSRSASRPILKSA